MTKYRIVKKGDKYSPECKSFLFWDNCESGWMSKEAACDLINAWKAIDKFRSSKKTYHGPENIC